jgi:hypothetical protein
VSAVEPVQLLDVDPVAELVERVARRVVELLDERDQGAARSPALRLVDAATLAGILGIGRATVYEHADELGAVQLGEGDRPRLRFDVEQARQRWTRRVSGEQSDTAETAGAPVARTPRRTRAARSVDGLLPVKDAAAA